MDGVLLTELWMMMMRNGRMTLFSFLYSFYGGYSFVSYIMSGPPQAFPVIGFDSYLSVE